MASKLKSFTKVLQGKRPQRGLVWGALILGALLAFEIFNYSTTDFAMTDLLGDLRFAGIRWATILAIAFCGIDFAGIARLFTPEKGAEDPMEVWNLFAAWLLAATMNAMLTWWGVSIAVLSQGSLGNAVVSRESLIKIVPIFVAVMVWLIRVLIIGTFSVAGGRIFSQSDARKPRKRSNVRKPSFGNSVPQPSLNSFRRTPVARSASVAPKPSYRQVAKSRSPQPELTYEPVNMKSNSGNSYDNSRS